MTAQANRVALITGGSRGIGFGIAESLAEEGWQLAINGVRAEAEVGAKLAVLRELGTRVEYCRGDVGETADRQAIIENVREKFGALHLLVNNAGITSPGRLDILEATEDAFDKVIDVNLKGALFLAKLAAHWMIEQKRTDSEFSGTIVNISSISGQFSSINRGDYCISWACLSQVTRVLAAELIEYGIQVYEIRPGIIRTDMTAGVTEKYDWLIANGLTAEPRWGTPRDIGNAVKVLARREFTYMPGATLTVDGGLTMLKDLNA